MKSGRTVERDILRLILGEVQTLEAKSGKKIPEEKIESIIRKVIQSNEETISFSPSEKLEEENKILSSFLPKTLTQDEIEAFFLNSSNAEYELIQSVKSEGQAIGLAIKTLKSNQLKVLGDDVKIVVEKIRNS